MKTFIATFFLLAAPEIELAARLGGFSSHDDCASYARDVIRRVRLGTPNYQPLGFKCEGRAG